MRPRHGDPRGRSVHEQMVHQCVSEDLWFRNMLGIDVGAPPLPAGGNPPGVHQALRGGQRQAPRRSCGETTNRGGKKTRTFFDVPPLAGVGHDAAHDAHVAPPRAADGDAAHAGPRSAQQLWAHRRHRRPDAESRADHLRVSQYWRPSWMANLRGAPRRRYREAAGSRSRSGPHQADRTGADSSQRNWSGRQRLAAQYAGSPSINSIRAPTGSVTDVL